MSRLSWCSGVRAELIDAARNEIPREACGVLLGRVLGTHNWRASAAVQCRNRAGPAGDSSFTLDPGDFVAAQKRAERLGEKIIGIWHSHPHAPARPSDRDLQGVWEGWIQVIIGQAAETKPIVRAWRVEHGSAIELQIEVTSGRHVDPLSPIASHAAAGSRLSR